MNPRKGKMRNLFYREVTTQECLKYEEEEKTSLARAVFKYKTRMANISEVFFSKVQPQTVLRF